MPNFFHLAIQVRDISEARRFNADALGCSADTWVNFKPYGHQLVCHLNSALGKNGKIAALYNPVDNHGPTCASFKCRA